MRLYFTQSYSAVAIVSVVLSGLIFDKDAALCELVWNKQKRKHFLQPISVRVSVWLTDDHVWVLRSVSDPARWRVRSEEGHWTVRTGERDGGRVEWANINSPCYYGRSICLNVRGRMEARTVSLDWLPSRSAAMEVKNLGCICLFLLAPHSLEKNEISLEECLPK